ncbi:MAG: PorT family protein [Bacteroidetes bacterium]|nr:PorT family protein [Bacteroidota bacterium]
MIRRVFLLGLFCVPWALPAQPGLHLGFRAGGQYTALSNQDDRDLGTYTARGGLIKPTGYVYAGHYLRNGWGLQAGVGFSRMGMRYEGPPQVGNPETYTEVTDVRLDYLIIPIMVAGAGQTRFRLQPSWNLGVQLNALQAALWMREQEYGDMTPPAWVHPAPKRLYRPTTWSAVASAGVQYRFYQSLFLHAHLRAEYSMMDAEDKKALDVDGTLFWEDRFYNTPSRNAATHPWSIGLVVGLTVVIDRRERNRYQGY